MSRSLFLYRYPGAPEDRYIEDRAQKIEECFIDDNVINEIEALESWGKLVVYEEMDSDANNTVTCIDNSKLESIKARIEYLFTRDVQAICATPDLAASLEGSITSIRTICNIHFLLKIKLEKYAMDKRAVIQLV